MSDFKRNDYMVYLSRLRNGMSYETLTVLSSVCQTKGNLSTEAHCWMLHVLKQ